MLSENQRGYVVTKYIEWKSKKDLSIMYETSINEIQWVLDKSMRLRRYIKNGVQYRICSKCKNHLIENKELFRIHTKKGCFYSTCKACTRTLRKVRYRDIREHEIESSKRWNRENKERVSERQRIKYATDPEYRKRAIKASSDSHKKKQREKCQELINIKRLENETRNNK